MSLRETLDRTLLNKFNSSGINSAFFAEGGVAGSSLGSEVREAKGLL